MHEEPPGSDGLSLVGVSAERPHASQDDGHMSFFSSTKPFVQQQDQLRDHSNKYQYARARPCGEWGPDSPNCCPGLSGEKTLNFAHLNTSCVEPRQPVDSSRTTPDSKPYCDSISSRNQTPGDVLQPDTAEAGIARLTLERKRAAKSDICSTAFSSHRASTGPVATPRPSSKYPRLSPHATSLPISQARRGQNIRCNPARKSHPANKCLAPRAKLLPPVNSKPKNDQVFSTTVEEVCQPQATMPLKFNAETSPPAKYPGILLQPESRSITNEQLAVEVKNIYSDLVAVEAKCISLDNAELASDRNKIDPKEREKWQAMMALHRTLLYEHHDFLSASQHPSAREPLMRLALKYSMPARMWRHAIHSFLEVLRRRLPDSMDYMLQFIYTAYQMIALLYETIQTFKATWIECLGDLARYRMAIEDGAQRDRETWGTVARSWYTMASDMNPQIGRLYHHLGILARPNAVQQLSFYCLSLTCIQRFPNAQESLATLLSPALESWHTESAFPYVHEADAILLYLHAAMFMGLMDGQGLKCTRDQYRKSQAEYVSRIGEQMNGSNGRWKEHGVSIAIANISACFAYGYKQSGNLLILAYEEGTGVIDESSFTTLNSNDQEALIRPASLLFSVFSAALQRRADVAVLPHVHVLLVFIRSMTSIMEKAHALSERLLRLVPWVELVGFLNSFAAIEWTGGDAMDDCLFSGPTGLGPKATDQVVLPEDYSLRGEIWSQGYLSEGWFKNELDDDTRYMEKSSTDKARAQRVLSLGTHIAMKIEHITFDAKGRLFWTSHKLDFFTASPSKVPTSVDQKFCTHETINGMNDMWS